MTEAHCVANPIAENFPAHLLALLRTVGEVAANLGMSAYLVGGPVRDALLGRQVVDIDIAVEGDARALAPVVASRLDGRVALHEEFWTATVLLPNGAPVDHIDLATARRETYQRPGALPTVEPASIGDDLRRRDFTVNAMAMSLSPDDFGRLLDPTGGLDDLRRRLLRAISPTAFIDDATRIIRAAVYCERLGFDVEPATEKAIADAVAQGYVETVTPQRHGEQLRRGLVTDAAGHILLRLAQWDVLSHLGLPPHPAHPVALRQVHAACPLLQLPREACAAAAFALCVPGPQGARAADRLALGRRFSSACAQLDEAVRRGLPDALSADTPLSRLEDLLSDFSPPVVAAVWALADEAVRQLIYRWWRQRRSALQIDGRDLISAGLPKGPAIGEGLKAALRAALDGRATDAASQLQVAINAARHWLEEHSQCTAESRGPNHA